ncbi:LysR family transcriptional regulator [Sphingomonas sp. ID1715]|uniref:LysR family transcriptional regulator n=1 Tax=Sphingomonas sp. ID1715 TaxID=1656898 RepID=UPI00148764CB|nr:LysR family transcriptional regulator [Sphingomonas sp. ID1715]NNM77421.1 LysR family transcriptional regulator [Sphingomonas sp. ID1715]
MIRPYLPLNNLRAFEAAARHLSFTNASIELRVTPAALSHQVKALEERLGLALFHRLPRGLALTDEGRALLPVLSRSLDEVAAVIERLTGSSRAVLSVGVVGTFAVGWLLPRLDSFRAVHPDIDLRLSTNNNRVDLAEEGLDLAIRFGDGAWHGTTADPIMAAPVTPLCAAALLERLNQPADLLSCTLFRSYRADDWTRWFAAAGLQAPVLRGPVFDSSRLMVDAALEGLGVALAPASMFARELDLGRLVRPFDIEADIGSYWLTYLKSRTPTPEMTTFSDWLRDAASEPPR